MTDSRDQHETYGHTESPIISALQKQIARLKAERDDVRREYCRRIACPLMDITDENDEDRMEWKAREIADKFKWDCFGGAA